MKTRTALTALVLFLCTALAAQTTQTLPFQKDSDDTSPSETPLRIRNDGRTEFHGSGQFLIDAQGSLQLSDKAHLNVDTPPRSLQEERQDNGWIYKNFDNKCIIAGSNIRFRMDGQIREMSGVGSGLLIMEGVGGYSLPSRAGIIPQSGVTIELGSPGQDNPGFLITNKAVFPKASPTERTYEGDFRQFFETFPNAVYYTTPETDDLEKIDISVAGTLQLYGSGTYTGRLQGTLIVDGESRVRISNGNDKVTKKRLGDGWLYQNVDSAISVRGDNIQAMFKGNIPSLKGTGSGGIQLKGDGTYDVNGRSGIIPARGVVIEFGKGFVTPGSPEVDLQAKAD